MFYKNSNKSYLTKLSSKLSFILPLLFLCFSTTWAANENIIITVAGNGMLGCSGNGELATDAGMDTPSGIAIDSSGTIYFSTLGTFYISSKKYYTFAESLIRKIDTSGTITSVAGVSDMPECPGNGTPATQNTIFPMDVAVDSSGNIYFPSFDQIRKVDPSGNFTVFAGGGSTLGDGGQATDASVLTPRNVALDTLENLFIADAGNHRIRKVDPFGIITTVAGNGISGYSGDFSPAIQANLYYPSDVAVDSLGNLYIADKGNHCIRKVDSSGIITTVVGNGIEGFSGDGGSATVASLSSPASVAVDYLGNLYIADSDNLRIRKVLTSGFVLGDVAPRGKPDGMVDIADVLVMMRLASRLIIPTSEELLRGDVAPRGNPDGEINISDALLVMRTVLGLTYLSDDDTDGDGFKPSDGDCNNNDPAIYPGAPEINCDGIDQDCDGSDSCPTTCTDNDGDGYGNPGDASCLNGSALDCNDNDPNIYPGAPELCDGLDNDCNTAIPANETDTDLDTYRICENDCNDTAHSIHPGAVEFCDSIDNNCDTQTDEGCVITSITISPKNVTLNTIGSSRQLTVKGQFNDGNTTDLSASSTGTIYNSDNPSTATVSTEGLVTAVSDGTATITATNSGLSSNSTVLVQTTSVPPQITINSPQDNSRIGSLIPFIDISYTDSGTTLDLATLKIAINGIDKTSDFTVTSSNASYQTLATDPIYEEENTIQVDLADTSGTYANDIFTFTIDIDPPGFTIINLPEGVVTVDNTYSLIGAIDPDVASVTVGGIDATLNGGYFIFDPSPLSPGTSTIEVVVIDNVGNTSTQTITIEQTSNTEGISVNVSSPANGATVNAGTVDILGIYAGAPSSITINNVQATMNGGTFTAVQVPLSVGTNPITVSAYDSSGNVSTDNILIFTSNTDATLTLISNPSTGLAPLSVTLTANTALSGITNYNWDLDGDGTIDSGTTTNTTTTIYTEVRRYFPTVIINSGGAQYSSTILVETVLPETLSASTVTNSPIDILRDRSTGEIYVLNNTDIKKYDSDISSAQIITYHSVTPGSFAVDFSTGKIYYTDTTNNEIKVYDPAGDWSPATSVSLFNPNGIALDSSGNVYIADTGHHRIRKVDTSGIITTVAGSGAESYSGDNGPAISAELNDPSGVAVDPIGNIYIADKDNHCIRKVDTSGIITTVAGNGSSGFTGDNSPAVDATLNTPTGVAADSSGNIYIADYYNHRIRMVEPNGVITTIAGSGSTGNFGGGSSGDNGPAVDAKLNNPTGVAIDSFGNIYIADTDNDRIRKVDNTGTITTVAGGNNLLWPSVGDGGLAIDANLRSPTGIYADSSGNIYIADRNNQRIRKVDDSGTITTVAGNGSRDFSGDNGPAIDAGLLMPSGVVVAPSGDIYIADTFNNRIRRVDSGGTIITVAGNGSIEVSISTTTFKSGLTSPYGIAINEQGEILVSDGSEILQLDSAGYVKETITGDPGAVFKGLHIDFIGNIYAVDSGNSKIIKYSSGGTKELEFGIAGSGDGEFTSPTDVSLDEINNQILVADTGNNRIQTFFEDGTFIRAITDDGNGIPLSTPSGVASGTSDPGQFVLTADTGNSRIVKIELPVLDPTQVWNAMKVELTNGDVQAALGYFAEGSKTKYSQVFTDVGGNLSSLASAMNPIRKSFIKGGVAEYKIDRDVDLGGGTETLTFPIYFEKDENGVWKIVGF